MARDIICDVDHVEVATWLVGDLKTGDQVGLCDDHLIAWGLAQIDTMLDEGQRLVAISKLAEKLPEPPTVEEGPPPEPKREVDAAVTRHNRRAKGTQPPPGLARAISAEIEHAESPSEAVAGEPAPADDG